ncbi:MAG TPA: deoxyribodipyrimidine photolyase, partial [Balneola sp.]|nr:deoxyribodipyrimidine photolyase [Balneola sp.]
MFTTKYSEILEQIDQVDPINYGRTRNFIDGDVSKLSPYISRGVISTKQVM